MPESCTSLSRSGTGLSRLLASIAVMAAITGCAAPGGMHAVSTAEPTFLRLTEERVFAQALRQRYLELATNAYDRGDFERSDFYTLRAIMAVEGKLVQPAGEDADGAFAAARIRLERSLSGGTRLGSPDLAARGQAAYDCWWLESQSGGDANIAEACRVNTFQALAEIETVGTGTRLAAARQYQGDPQQVVIDRETPSQTIDAGGATIQIINQPITYEAPPAPNYVQGQAAQQDSYTSYLPAQPAQHRRVLSRTAHIAEPMQAAGRRTFMVEAPTALAPPHEVAPLDRVIPTVAISGSTAFEPIDLIPEPTYTEQPDGPLGGQYVPIDTSPMSEMSPIYDPAIETVPFERYAALEPQYGPVYSDAAVYTDTPAQTLIGGPAIMETVALERGAEGADYSVFFGFDSDAITLEGEDVLIDTVERLILEDRNTVMLMGFTDSAGDSRYNQLLAMRRANAVRKYLQNRTDRPLTFEIMPVGEAEAVRNGGDGMTEALNRRVEIKIR